MQLWLMIAFTLILGSVAIQNVYVAIKPVVHGEKKDLEEIFSYGDGPFMILGLLFSFMLWCSEKFFPEKHHIAAFRLVSLMIAASLIGLIVLIWNVEVVTDFLLDV